MKPRAQKPEAAIYGAGALTGIGPDLDMSSIADQD